MNWVFYAVDKGAAYPYNGFLEKPIKYLPKYGKKPVFLKIIRGEDIRQQENRLKAAKIPPAEIDKIISQRRADQMINSSKARLRIDKATKAENERLRALEKIKDYKVVKEPTERTDILDQLIEKATDEASREKLLMKRRIEKMEREANDHASFAIELFKNWELDKENGKWKKNELLTDAKRAEFLEAVKNHEDFAQKDKIALKKSYDFLHGDKDKEVEEEILAHMGRVISPELAATMAKLTENQDDPYGMEVDVDEGNRDSDLDEDLVVQPLHPEIPQTRSALAFGNWNGMSYRYFTKLSRTSTIEALRLDEKWNEDNRDLFLKEFTFTNSSVDSMLRILGNVAYERQPITKKFDISHLKAAVYFLGPRQSSKNKGRFSRKRIATCGIDDLIKKTMELCNPTLARNADILHLLPIFYQAFAVMDKVRTTHCWPVNKGFSKYAIPHLSSNNHWRLLPYNHWNKVKMLNYDITESDDIGEKVQALST